MNFLIKHHYSLWHTWLAGMVLIIVYQSVSSFFMIQDWWAWFVFLHPVATIGISIWFYQQIRMTSQVGILFILLFFGAFYAGVQMQIHYRFIKPVLFGEEAYQVTTSSVLNVRNAQILHFNGLQPEKTYMAQSIRTFQGGEYTVQGYVVPLVPAGWTPKDTVYIWAGISVGQSPVRYTLTDLSYEDFIVNINKPINTGIVYARSSGRIGGLKDAVKVAQLEHQLKTIDDPVFVEWAAPSEKIKEAVLPIGSAWGSTLVLWSLALAYIKWKRNR